MLRFFYKYFGLDYEIENKKNNILITKQPRLVNLETNGLVDLEISEHKKID
jgi:hypothetical protein